MFDFLKRLSVSWLFFSMLPGNSNTEKISMSERQKSRMTKMRKQRRQSLKAKVVLELEQQHQLQVQVVVQVPLPGQELSQPPLHRRSRGQGEPAEL